jgi:hypothetical protein
MARLRSADDFTVIRARLVELQRERDQALRRTGDQPKSRTYFRPLAPGSAETVEEEEFRPFRERFGR